MWAVVHSTPESTWSHWVRDVLVWTNGPLLLSNHIMAADAVDEERVASLEQVKRLGDDPVAATLRIGAATAESPLGTRTARCS